MNYYKAKFIGPSNSKGSRIVIVNIDTKKRKFVVYNYLYCGVVKQVEDSMNMEYLFQDGKWYYFKQVTKW